MTSKKPDNITEADLEFDAWFSSLLAVDRKTAPETSSPQVVEDYDAPRPPGEPFWKRFSRPDDPDPTIDDLLADPEFTALLDEVIADTKKREGEESAASTRVIHDIRGPYPEGIPLFQCDWSKFSPSDLLAFWMAKLQGLSRHADAKRLRPGCLTRAEIAMLLFMRGCTRDELKALGLTPNVIERAAREILEAAQRGELPQARVPDAVRNSRNIGSKKAARKTGDKRAGSRWLKASGEYHDVRECADEFEDEEDPDE